MVQDSTCAMTLPQAKPAAMIASCFQSQDSAFNKCRKSLKNNDLSPPPQFSAVRLRSFKPLQGPDDRCADVRRFIRCRMGRGLYGSICVAPYALSARARRLQRCGLSAPAYQGSPLFKPKAGSKGACSETLFGSDYSGGGGSVSGRGVSICRL